MLNREHRPRRAGAVLAVAVPAPPLAGVGFAAMSVASGYLIQSETRPAMKGRVSATVATLDEAVPLPAPLAAGLLAAWWGLGQTYAAAGIALMLVGAAMVALRALGRARELAVDRA